MAVVGPAETLLKTRRGKMIDAHDLVVRFNTAIQYMPFSKRLVSDIGTRTDILYCNNEVFIERILHQKNISHRRFKEVCERAGIKYLVATNNDFTFPPAGRPTPVCWHEALVFSSFLRQQGVRAGFRMLSETSALARRLLEGYVGRTGFLAILDLLSYDLSRLSILGMTFYHRGGHLFLDYTGELHPMKDHLGREPQGQVKGHNSYLELGVMRKLSAIYGPRLELDEPLRALLEGREA